MHLLSPRVVLKQAGLERTEVGDPHVKKDGDLQGVLRGGVRAQIVDILWAGAMLFGTAGFCEGGRPEVLRWVGQICIVIYNTFALRRQIVLLFTIDCAGLVQSVLLFTIHSRADIKLYCYLQ